MTVDQNIAKQLRVVSQLSDRCNYLLEQYFWTRKGINNNWLKKEFLKLNGTRNTLNVCAVRSPDGRFPWADHHLYRSKNSQATIQTLLFCVVGMALGAGIAVHWAATLTLATTPPEWPWTSGTSSPTGFS